jgi:hypothetical protein
LQLSEVTSNPDSGILGFLAILVLAGPFLRDFWKDPPALLGGVLPLGFMLLVAYRIAASIQAALAAQMTGPYESLHSNLRYGIFDVLSVGLGTYLSASLAVYFAVLSIKQLVGSRRLRERRIGSSQKMAA